MTVSAQVIDVLDHLCTKFGLAIDWTQANVMPYLEELAGKYISWECATSTMWLVIGVILFVVGVILMVTDFKYSYADGIMIMAGFWLVFFGAIIIGQQVYDIITCKYFPEKMLWDYLSTMMKT